MFRNPKTKKNEWVPIPQLIKKFQDKFNVVIFDEAGTLTYTQGVCIVDNCVLIIDFSAYKNGVYFIAITKDDKVYKNKIIKTD